MDQEREADANCGGLDHSDAAWSAAAERYTGQEMAPMSLVTAAGDFPDVRADLKAAVAASAAGGKPGLARHLLDEHAKQNWLTAAVLAFARELMRNARNAGRKATKRERVQAVIADAKAAGRDPRRVVRRHAFGRVSHSTVRRAMRAEGIKTPRA
jgi:hypothetical protein